MMQNSSIMRLGSVSLPLPLQNTMEDLLKGLSRKNLKMAAMHLRNHLRGTSPRLETVQKENMLLEDAQTLEGTVKPMNMTTQSDFVYDNTMTMAYLTEFFPSLYAINLRIMTEIKRRLTDFTPRSILDYGCGPGSASIAIMDTWVDQIEHVAGIDISDDMLETAKKLMDQKYPNFAHANHFTLQKYLPVSLDKPYDLVVASYSLNELRQDALRLSILETLWALTKDILVVIQPGNATGFEQLLQVREWVLSQINERHEAVAYAVAPCPHDRICPLINSKDWCCFAQRSDKTLTQREIHGGCVNYMDERYSYIVLRRQQRPIVTKESSNESFAWSRLIKKPLLRPGHVLVDVCDTSGDIRRHIISKSRGREVYKDARNVFWGDLWPHNQVKEDAPSSNQHENRKKRK